jgi:hypothetical protein
MQIRTCGSGHANQQSVGKGECLDLTDGDVVLFFRLSLLVCDVHDARYKCGRALVTSPLEGRLLRLLAKLFVPALVVAYA